MPLKDITLLHNIDELLKKFDECAKDYNYITFYCSNLNKFYSDLVSAYELRGEIINKLFELKFKNKFVEIITNSHIDKKSILESKNKISNFKITRGKTSIDVSLVFDEESIVEELAVELMTLVKKYAPDTQTLTFFNASRIIVENFQNAQSAIESILKNLENKIKDKIEELLKNEEFDDISKAKESVEETFSILRKNIKNKSTESDEVYIIKETIETIFSLIDAIIHPSKIDVALFIFDAFMSVVNIKDYSESKGFYSFASPVANLLAKKFSFVFNLIETRSLCDIVVFKSFKDSKDGYFIDFSGFDPFSENEDVNTDDYLGVCGFVKGGIDLFQNRLINDEVGSIRQEYGDAMYSIYKNMANSKDEASMYGFLSRKLSLTHANFTYIQHPFFNSFKFAKLISNKSNKHEDSKFNTAKYSGLSKNYLVISNAPTKQNAGLSERVLTKALGYTIKDDINRTDTAARIQDPNSFTPIKDYSRYSIEITSKDEKDAYVLSLSPFVRIDKSTLDDYKQYIKKIEKKANTSLLGIINYNDYDKQLKLIKNLNHINKFFKQYDDVEILKKKEKEYLKDSIKYFESLFNGINAKYFIGKIDSYSDDLVEYCSPLTHDKSHFINTRMGNVYMTNPHSVLEVFLLSIIFYTMKHTYSSNAIRALKIDKDEYISIYGNKFKVLNKDAFIQYDENKRRIYFFKQNKIEAKDEDALCVEEITEKFYKNFSMDDEYLFDDSFYEFIQTLEDKNNTNEDFYEEEKINECLDQEISKNKQEYERLKQSYSHLIEKENHIKREKKFLDEFMMSFADKILTELFPISEIINNKDYSYILKVFLKVMFESKNLRDILIKEFGMIAFMLQEFPWLDGQLRVKGLISKYKAQKFVERNIGKKSFVNQMQISKKRYLAWYVKTYKPLSYKEKLFFKELRKKGILQDIRWNIGKDIINQSFSELKSMIIKSGLSSLIKTIVSTEYEQRKKEYQDINYKRFLHKYNDPYAVENISLCPLTHKASSNEKSSYLYYPMNIYSSFMSIDLKDMFIGGRLSSGGLDYNSFIYYEMDNSNLKTSNNLSKQLPLNKLLAYLCLDELRTTSDKSDHKYFRHLKGKEFGFMPEELKIAGFNRELNISKLNPIPIEHRNEMYRVYQQGSEDEVDIPIDKYNESMEILNDFSRGIYNTDEETKQDDKARRLLKALNVIGQNNLKGMYVGCKKEDKNSLEEIPPRLIGRLATTIIMEDGLYIG
ncbi:hypothetical protein [Campylobacter sp. CCUG 57310]|uniref:hypothetical protein n=1 Tax=Campylobacter sp. CCUG 57310 TaxID=2517362 RepID=UPI001564EBAE|nr:hypothetical protein [Campylobacter sp. CCUG 57310]QKF92893.1 hypothetical protein CORI_1725 [Campylobacter sp. CCUG 57310]